MSAAMPDWIALDGEVRVLAPAAGSPLSAYLARSPALAEPFSPERCQAVAALSVAFLRDPALRADPATVAVAYWMRAANVARLAAAFTARREAEPGVVRVPAGRVLHLAPANVDTLFVYSWALAFLAGNASVVRLSQERPPDVEAMLRVIEQTAREHGEIERANRFVTYPHEATATAALSGWCSQRIVWGGDETVAAIRAIPLPAHAAERAFGSKFSYAVFAAAPYLAAEPAERDRVASAFFNDLFWFDQMACSSPQVVFWVGAAAQAQAAVPEFEQRLQAEVMRKSYAPSAAAAVHRLTEAFDLAADRDVAVVLEHSGFIGVRVKGLAELDKRICGGGLIRHVRLDRLEELESFAGDQDQTVTAYGFDAGALRALAARIGARGVDRIVPVGEALAFQPTWDGFDLLDDLTRRVVVPG